jgi:hypothetical protein
MFGVQDQNKIKHQISFGFAYNSKTKAAAEKVNMPVCGTIQYNKLRY